MRGLASAMDSIDEDKFEQFLSSAVEKVEQDRVLSTMQRHGIDTPGILSARVSDILGGIASADADQSIRSQARPGILAPVRLAAPPLMAF